MGVLYEVRYVYSVLESLCANPFHLVELSSFHLDFSITHLYLPIFLGLVWSGDAMVYSIFLQ